LHQKFIWSLSKSLLLLPVAFSRQQQNIMSKEEAKEDLSDMPDPDLKIILLGDSAVGKSKLVEV